MDEDKRRINVRAIVWHDDKLLAVKHKTSEGGESTYWALPGGGLDPFESLADGVKREMIEETGIEPQVGRILFGQQFRSERQHRDEELEFFIHVTNPEDYTDIDLSQTTHGDEELARCEFIDPKHENILPKFLQTIDIRSYIDTVQPVYIADNFHEEAE